MMKRNVIAQIQKGLDLEHYESLKPGQGPKLGTDTDDRQTDRQTKTHTHRIMYRLAPQVKRGKTVGPFYISF